MTLLDDVKKSVDAQVWCDRIRWHGRRVTLQTDLKAVPEKDPTGAGMVAGWKQELDRVAPRSVRVAFVVKQYGLARTRPDAVTRRTTYCWATFEVLVL